ncbi:MAG: NUDIX hydrolase [Rubrivivax sp.]|jgi:ADP-ribose pyrophosphatase YjhB (NUDIX family)|nr:NUDIX hydrolase [Rubrivivax sp.]
MSTDRWTPRVTVAAIIESQGRYLLVEEQTADGLRLNNPAGHLERGETPEQAVVREALEESARAFVPEALVGVYLARLQGAADEAGARSDLTYLRFAFAGRAGDVLPGRALDAGIERTLWLTLAEVRASASRHRSPLVLRCIEDHAAGRRYPLQTLVTHPGLGLA